MGPVTIDVLGTIKQLVKFVLTEVFLILAMIAFGLSAPVLLSVGGMWLAYQFPDSAPTWAIVYLLVGPFACAVWMSVVSHWPDWVADWKARKAGVRIVRDKYDRIHAFYRGLGFMFGGLFASYLAEAVLVVAAHYLRVIPKHMILFFAVAPFAVFAPCWVVVLRRWIRRDRYAVA